jgi:phosphatidylethanolamine/phosphatidyl-N-methylethanolamine N-methyltransferase
MQHRIKRAKALALDLRAHRPQAAEYLDFLAAWVKKPKQTASVVPSSRYLARLMVREVRPDGGRVLELGGGTGVFTRAILATGLPADKLEVVEINPAFARGLRRHFPGVSILEVPAQAVSASAAGAPGEYQTVVSGLPLLAMDQSMHAAILCEAFAMLAPGGSFVQFTYSLRPPVNRDILDALDLDVERVGQTVRNFPPATVFRFVRKGERA